MTTATPSTKRRGRFFLSLFFVGLVAACALLTVGVTTRLNETREQLADWNPGYKCIKILRGDLVEVTDYETTNRVQLLGMTCPPPTRDSDLDALSVEWALPEDELLQHGITARDTLTTWIYKRQIQFEFPGPEVETLADAARRRQHFVGGEAESIGHASPSGCAPPGSPAFCAAIQSRVALPILRPS